jgi:O-antigen/teichoic acid export membrane protein
VEALLSLSARAITLVVALVCGVLTARLVLGDAGVEQYALYSLIASLPGLVSFFDLGSGAAVVNSIASSDDARHDVEVRAQTRTVLRIMLSFAAAVLLIDIVLYTSGLWAAILGDVGDIPGAQLVAFACVALFAIGLPLNVWQRILLGFRRNHIIILVQGVQAPVGLVLVWGLLRLDDESAHVWLSSAAYVAALVVGIIGIWLATRVASPLLGGAARGILTPRRAPGARVMDVGWPMFAQLVATPLSMTLQRYILAQYLTAHALAEYAAAGQVFFALQGLVAAAGLALWPAYTRARHDGRLVRGPFILAGAFAACSVVATIIVVIVSPWLFGFISAGTLTVAPATILWFGAMVTAQAALFPLGMFIMDKRGIRFQVIPVFLMAGASVTASVILTPMIGITAPLIANTLSVAVFQIIPFSVYIVLNRERLLSTPPTTAELIAREVSEETAP